MDRTLVTGVAGFIGSHLAEALLERGVAVRGVDNFATGDPDRLESLREFDGFSFVEGDLRHRETVESVVEDVDTVFHQAAVPSVPRSVEDPVTTATANCVGTTNLVDAARDSAVETLVVASSSSVYGSEGELPRREDQPVDPESPYALSKFWTERLAVQASELYGIDSVALRYFNVFGPGQDPEGEYAAVVPKFVDRMLDGERPVIYGDGKQSRDFTYISNAIEANLEAAGSDCRGEVLNVGCGGRLTVNELVDHLNEILGTAIEPVYADPRPGDVRHSYADIGKARKLIGYEPSVRFREGLERMVETAQEY